jgi:hypothetical protein
MKTRLECVVDNSAKKWLKNGFLHREDGPAVIRGSGVNQVCEYWLNGCLVTASMLELHRTLTPEIESMVSARAVVNLEALRVK